jgi:hypothetical protein
LAEIAPTEVAVHDPVLDEGPNRLTRDSFLLAWEEFDSLAAIIIRA